MNFTPFISLFDEYPKLLQHIMPAVLTQSQRECILGIGEIVGATRYPDRVKQRMFLDEKTTALVRFSLFRVLFSCD